MWPVFLLFDGIAHIVRFSWFFWHIFDKSCKAHMRQALGLYYSLILNSGRWWYSTFGTMIKNCLNSNSGCFLGAKWQKRHTYKNDSWIVKIVHTDIVDDVVVIIVVVAVTIEICRRNPPLILPPLRSFFCQKILGTWDMFSCSIFCISPSYMKCIWWKKCWVTTTM